MKLVGIRKIYYSAASNRIVCENVKDMVSIQSSSVAKCIEKLNGNKLVDFPNKYYEALLLKNFPSTIKPRNLENFIRYNFSNVLPDYNVIINKSNVRFIDSNKKAILTAKIQNV